MCEWAWVAEATHAHWPILRPMSNLVFDGTAVDTAAATRLVNETIERYAAWCEKSAAVRVGYGQWSSAVRAERAICFAAYTAALDREGCAAEAYAESVRRLSRFL
jgi:hypothetical protein